MGDRCAGQPVLQMDSESDRDRQIALAQQQVVATDAQCMGHQQFGVEPGGVADRG